MEVAKGWGEGKMESCYSVSIVSVMRDDEVLAREPLYNNVQQLTVLYYTIISYDGRSH